jgi:ArsR family transcriptional regulator, arsenate/arsenite/antimonite-responsive transcriptional repressor
MCPAGSLWFRSALARGELARVLTPRGRRGSIPRSRDEEEQAVKSTTVPLYQAKAEFFRMLGHPVRIRVLELLQDGPMPVRDLLAAIEIERSSLSQQLAVLRRSGIVSSVRDGDTVVYSLAGPDVAELMRAARRILTELITGQQDLLAELREADSPAGSTA